MKLGEIYKHAVAKGKKEDPRGMKIVEEELQKVKKDYEKLSKEDKEDYDKDRFFNPYGDTRILYGNPEKEIKTVLVGVDMETPELLAAQMLRMKGEKIDLVIAHHPEGRAFASLHEVMHIQTDLLNKYGVPINVAEDLMNERIKEVFQGVMPVNHQRPVDIAKLFDIPFMCIHTPADNCVTSFLQKIFDAKKPKYISDVVKLLKEVPEYKNWIKMNNGPQIVVGSPDKRAGRVYVDMTGGTEGSVKVFEKLSNTDIGTLVCMHLSQGHIKELEKNHISGVIAGHISSDTVGLNVLFDEIFKKEKMKIIPISGYRRIER